MDYKRKSLAHGAVVLAIGSFLAKAIGALYRIPLTNILGAQGMGLYQLVFPLYALLLTISGTGFPSAIARLISQKTAIGDGREAKKVLIISLISLSALGIAAAILVFLLAGAVSSLQGNADAALAYRAIAPSIFFVAISSCLRGYFQGRMNMTPSALSQVAEQVVKLAIGLLLASVFLSRGIQWAVMGASLGISASELVAMAVLAIEFAFFERKYPLYKGRAYALADFKKGAGELFGLSLPVILAGIILPLTQVIDSALIINILVAQGEKTTNATASFGVLSGTIGSLINMPVVLSAGVCAVALPALSFYSTQKNKAQLEHKMSEAFRFCWLIALPSAAGLIALSTPIMRLLYSRGLSEFELELGAQLLRISSLSIIYMALVQFFTAMLQGMGRFKLPLIGLCAGSIVKLVLTIVLTRKMGISGAALSNALCFLTAAIFGAIFTAKYARFGEGAKSVRFAGFTALCAAIMAVAAYQSNALMARLMGGTLAVLGAICVGALCYLILLLVLGIIRREDLIRLHLIKK